MAGVKREGSDSFTQNLFSGLASVLNWHMFVYTSLSRMMIFGLFNSNRQQQNAANQHLNPRHLCTQIFISSCLCALELKQVKYKAM